VRDTGPDKVSRKLVRVSGGYSTEFRLVGGEERVAGALDLSSLHVNSHRDKVPAAREAFKAEVLACELENNLLELVKEAFVKRAIGAVGIHAAGGENCTK
jgi:hypothetical protein